MSTRIAPGRAPVPGTGSELAGKLAALDEVLALAGDRLDAEALTAGRQLATKAGERLRVGADHTVVALAGATGSGKSSLFNALAGTDLSTVGYLRPTTATAHAAIWGRDGAAALLDWLDVPRRHQGNQESELDGLVLLDLPDIDSVRGGHRVEADRLVDLVDLLVWVVDPQKYADAVLHERYLAPLAGHAEVTVLVLNQVDRLDADGRAACLADLSRLLGAKGMAGVPVLPVSARTGEGLPELRELLVERVAAKRASAARLSADLDRVAAGLAAGCGPGDSPGVRPDDRTALVGTLADAAGADLVAAAVFRSHRIRSRAATGWPFTRWVARIPLDPLRRLRLPTVPNELVRTSLPGPSAVQRARVETAVRTLTDHAGSGLPDPWPRLVRQAATASNSDLPDQLDRAVAGTDLALGRTPRWWTAARLAQTALAAVTVVGLLWLVALFVIGWLRLPDPPTPELGFVPWPTVLLLGGAVLGLLLSFLAGRLSLVGAARRSRRARERIVERVEEVAESAVLFPVERELGVRRELCAAVDRLR